MVLGPFAETKERVLSHRRRNLVARGRHPAYANFILTAGQGKIQYLLQEFREWVLRLFEFVRF